MASTCLKIRYASFANSILQSHVLTCSIYLTSLFYWLFAVVKAVYNIMSLLAIIIFICRCCTVVYWWLMMAQSAGLNIAVFMVAVHCVPAAVSKAYVVPYVVHIISLVVTVLWVEHCHRADWTVGSCGNLQSCAAQCWQNCTFASLSIMLFLDCETYQFQMSSYEAGWECDRIFTSMRNDLVILVNVCQYWLLIPPLNETAFSHLTWVSVR